MLRTDPDPADQRVQRVGGRRSYWSDGPEEVPSVVGMTGGRGPRRVLERAGFDVDVVYDSETVAEKGQVLQQSPEAYTEQPQGTVVVITVSSYEEPSESPSPTPTETVSPSVSVSPSVVPTD